MARKAVNRKMAKPVIPSYVEKIKGLRARLGLTQEQFAKILGTKQPTVGGWESGDKDYKPSREAYLSMGAAAPADVAFWFLECAGLPRAKVLSLAEEENKARGAAPATGEIVRVPLEHLISARREKRGEFFLLPSLVVPNPLRTVALFLDETADPSLQVHGGAFASGSTVVIDESSAAGPGDDLSGVIGSVVAFDFSGRGISFGRLRLREAKLYFAFQLWLGPVVLKEGVKRDPSEDSLEIGQWQPEGAPAEPAAGSKRAVAAREVEEALARENALRSEASRGGTENYSETKEITEAANRRRAAQKKLLDAENAEKQDIKRAARSQARAKIRLDYGRILGRLIAWFPPSEPSPAATGGEEGEGK